MADEPTAGLDVSVQGEILNMITDLKARLGLSFLIISHNLAMLRHVADQIAILYLGRLVETGPANAVFARLGVLGLVVADVDEANTRLFIDKDSGARHPMF